MCNSGDNYSTGNIHKLAGPTPFTYIGSTFPNADTTGTIYSLLVKWLIKVLSHSSFASIFFRHVIELPLQVYPGSLRPRQTLAQT